MRRWLRRIALALLVLVGVLLLGILGAWLYLTSDAGSERIRALALGAAGDALAGKLEAKKLSLSGGIIVLEDVKLYTPEGELVAELKRAEIDVGLRPLIARRVVIHRADLDGLRLYLASDERGLNLTRAVAAKTPSPPAGGPPAAFHVDVRGLKLQHGHVSWQQDYRLDEIGIEGAAVIEGPGLHLGGELTATASLRGEPVLPLTLAAKGDEKKLGVALALGGAHLDGDLSLDDVSARIETLFVPPEVAQRFSDAFPLKVPLQASGEASLKRVDLKLTAGSAHATAKATFPEFELDASDIDLHELLGQGHPSKIHVDAKGRFEPQTLDGDLALNASWTKVGAATVRATAKQGTFEISKGNVKVSGAELDVHGTGSAKALHLDGQLDLDDLSKVSSAISEATGAQLPPLYGTGNLELSVDGAPRHARVHAAGKFQALHVSDVSFNAVTLDASLQDVSRPFEAQLNATVARITAQERSFDDVRARIDTRGRELDLELTTKGYAEIALVATGTVDRDGKGIALADLKLRYPEAEWKLESPTHVSIADGLEVEPLALVSVDQRLAAQATLKRGHLDALVDLKNVDLTRLPHAFVPTKWGLGGKVDAHATATGRSAAPEADASITWREGSVRTLRGLQLTAQARYAKERTAGTLEAKSRIGDVAGRFDLPLKGLTSKVPSDEPLSADVTVSAIVLESLGPMLELDLPMKGTAQVRVEASGTAAKPRATVHAEAKDAVWVLQERGGDRFVPVDQLNVDVKPDDSGALYATVNARAFGAEADVRLGTPLTLEGMRAKPPTLESLRATVVDLIANVNHVDLATLNGANLIEDETLNGRVSVSLRANGTVDHPDLNGTVTARQLSRGRVKPLDADVTVESGREATNVKLALPRLGELSVKAFAPVEQLADPSVALQGSGNIGPFALNDVLEPSPDEVQPRGTVKAEVEVSGSLVDPKVGLRGQLEQVALGKVALGKANVTFDYAKAVSTAVVTLFTGSSGTLRAKATVDLDLSQPALKKGVKWEKAPLQAEVVSKALDLSFLAGTLDVLPRLEGILDADGRVSGTLALPTFVGKAAYTHGRVAVMGYGEYREIELKLDGSDEALTLEKLHARSAGGVADLSGVAQKRGDGWHARLVGEAKNFPIVTDDQLKASLTVELQADALFTADLIDVQKLKLPRAVIELPEVKGKDLQDLERPENIILVRNGVPVNAKQRKKLEAAGEVAPTAQKPPARVIRVAIDAPQNIWLKSSDINAEVGLSESFRVEVANGATMFGEIQVKRGRLDVIGRRFDVDPSSTVRFAGLPTRAYVNVIATHKNEREGVTVFATVVGQLPQFSIRLTSQPPLSESDIFALVATGRRTLKQGGGAAISGDSVASVIGSLAASQLKGALGKKLPLDVLSIETGSDGLKGTRVEGGKYLTDQIYVGGEVRYGADPRKGENDVAVKLEYQFVPHWGLEAYGGNAAYGADLVWSREY